MRRAVLTPVIGVTGAPVSLGSRLVITVVGVGLEALPLPLASALALTGGGEAVVLVRILRARTKQISAGQATANDFHSAPHTLATIWSTIAVHGVASSRALDSPVDWLAAAQRPLQRGQ